MSLDAARSRLSSYSTPSGGYGLASADLFCGYAATSVLAGIDCVPSSKPLIMRATTGFAGRIGGVAPSRGQQPDAWSTAYACGTLYNLSADVPKTWIDFLKSLEQSGGFSMSPDIPADAWSTGFAASTLAKIEPGSVDSRALVGWVGRCQIADGGLTWSQTAAALGLSDIRATGFLIDAVAAANGISLLRSTLDMDALIDYIRSRQDPMTGGFSLNPRNEPCLWGTGEAVAALSRLGAVPSDRNGCIEFVRSHYDPVNGGFRRGPAYSTGADVWATRQAVRTLSLLGADMPISLRSRMEAFIGTCQLASGGFTYRKGSDAPDALATASALLVGVGNQADVEWLTMCVMPGEGGYAYMPARGAEARCAQWATAALAACDVSPNVAAVVRWAEKAQNSDGGFGPWAGRTSETTSTCAAVRSLRNVGALASFGGLTALRRWIEVRADAVLTTPNADGIAIANVVRSASALSGRDAVDIDHELASSKLLALSTGGAFRRSLRSAPDLATTYSAVRALQCLGDFSHARPARHWVNQLIQPDGAVAWSQLSSIDGGPLAVALASLIVQTSDQEELPDLSL